MPVETPYYSPMTIQLAETDQLVNAILHRKDVILKNMPGILTILKIGDVNNENIIEYATRENVYDCSPFSLFVFDNRDDIFNYELIRRIMFGETNIEDIKETYFWCSPPKEQLITTTKELFNANTDTIALELLRRTIESYRYTDINIRWREKHVIDRLEELKKHEDESYYEKKIDRNHMSGPGDPTTISNSKYQILLELRKRINSKEASIKEIEKFSHTYLQSHKPQSLELIKEGEISSKKTKDIVTNFINLEDHSDFDYNIRRTLKDFLVEDIILQDLRFHTTENLHRTEVDEYELMNQCAPDKIFLELNRRIMVGKLTKEELSDTLSREVPVHLEIKKLGAAGRIFSGELEMQEAPASPHLNLRALAGSG